MKLKAGERVVRTKFGVDDEICTGDHSCIRLSGCPSLTVKPSPDPLRTDPVASVIESCVGCGLCGEVAHAAVLCPSFYRAELIQNASAWDRFLHRVRRTRDLLARAARGGGVSARPFTLLIAALGGEGGGVLTDWIVSAARSLRPAGAVDLDSRRRAAHRRHDLLHRDLPRAGTPSSAAGARCSRSRPASATSTWWWRANCSKPAARSRPGSSPPTARCCSRRPAASISRSRRCRWPTGAMTRERLIKAVEQNAKEHLLFDMEAAAKQAGAIVNSVMLGAIAGSGPPADPGRGVRGRDQGRTARRSRAT